MIISIEHKNKVLKADLSKPIDISIRLKESHSNPNCYWAKPPVFNVIREGEFVGSVEEGGNVNYHEITITPHGNGTHTECYGHISSDGDAVIGNIHSQHCLCKLLSLEPTEQNGDSIITYQTFMDKWTDDSCEAIAIRTLPNDKSKLTKTYTNTNPPYLDSKILEFLNKQGIKHLLVDLPSVDKEFDEGKLLGHKAFFGVPHSIRKNATITELIYIDDEIEDGIYFLNLGILNLALDACPSRPLLYKISGF